MIFPEILSSNMEVSDKLILRYCEFLYRYTFRMYGNKVIKEHVKASGGDSASVFSKVTPSDEAYAIFVYCNGRNYWAFKEEKKKMGESTKDKTNTKRFIGKICRSYLEDVWPTEGRDLYKRILYAIRKRHSNDEVWSVFMEKWDGFAKKINMMEKLEPKQNRRKEKKLKAMGEDDFVA